MIDPVLPFVRSYVPGRLRLRHPGLVGLEDQEIQALTQTVKSAPGITDCVVNSRVGSLLLTWDAEKLSEKDLLGYLEFWSAFLPDKAFEVASQSEDSGAKVPLAKSFLDKLQVLLSGKGSPAKRRRQLENRLTAVLAVATLASLFRGASLHAKIGSAFFAVLAWHVWKRRRTF